MSLPGTELAQGDPSALGGNVLPPVIVDAQVMSELHAINDRATANVSVHGSEPETVRATAEMADLSLRLLAEAARSGAIDSSDDELHMLTHRLGLVRTDERNQGRRSGEQSELLAGFLERGAERIPRHEDRGRAHSFHTRGVIDSATKLLDKAAGQGGIALDPESDLAHRLTAELAQHRKAVGEAQAKRAETMKGTVFDPESAREGVQVVDAPVGTSVRINLGGDPLLRKSENGWWGEPGQTEAMFHTGKRTDGLGGTVVEGFRGATVAFLQIEGTTFAVVDNREAMGRRSTGKSSKLGRGDHSFDDRYTGHVQLLELHTDETGGMKVDPMYGVEVSEDTYDFNSNWRSREGGQPVYLRNPGQGQGRRESGVTLEMDKRGQLVVNAGATPVRVLAKSDVIATEKDKEPLSRQESFAHQAKELGLRLDDTMVRGTSRFPWGPDLKAALDRAVVAANTETPTEPIRLTTGTALYNPSEWYNPNGEGDALKLFFGRFGGSREAVIATAQGLARQQMQGGRAIGSREHSETRDNVGSYVINTNIPGVTTVMHFGWTDQGVVSFLRPELVIDPNVNLEA